MKRQDTKPVIEDTLAEFGFPKSRNVMGRASIADLFRKNRCGIYVLHFSDDAYYVGQAVDVVRRYAQHRHTHKDIQRISFKKVGRKNLNRVERDVIRSLEDNGFRLRNIQITSFSYGETDFDLVMPPLEQQRWLEDLSIRDVYGERLIDEHLRSLYARKYRIFQQMPHAPEVIPVLREYVQASIPRAKQTEIAFWMCSCMLKDINRSFYFCRINVGFQATYEVFRRGDTLCFRWFITRRLAEQSFKNFGLPLRRLVGQAIFRDIPYNVDQTGLTQGGTDQVFIEVEGTRNARALLQDAKVVLALRQFNLGLMQKGPCPWGRFHCLDLADELVL